MCVVNFETKNVLEKLSITCGRSLLSVVTFGIKYSKEKAAWKKPKATHSKSSKTIEKKIILFCFWNRFEALIVIK